MIVRSLIAGRDRPGAPTESDREALLIAGIVARDLTAFEQLYRGYHSRLARFLLSVTHRPTIVEEVLNDTMMVVWDKADSFRGASRLSTWIFGIAYRKALTALRRQDLPIESPDTAAQISTEASPDATLGRAQSHDRLLQAMAALTADHRAVVDLTYFHGLGYREIAEVMDCPVDTVKTRMFHARRRLKTLLAGDAADWIWDE